MTTPVKQDYLDYVLGQLSEAPDFTYKKMFGGIDFFRGDAMWGAIMNEADSLRLKVDDTNRAAFEAAGMEPFYMEKMQRSMPYWTVLRAVLANKVQLAAWMEQAAAVAARDKKKKK